MAGRPLKLRSRYPEKQWMRGEDCNPGGGLRGGLLMESWGLGAVVLIDLAIYRALYNSGMHKSNTAGSTMSGGWPEAPGLPRDPDDRWAVIRRRSWSRVAGNRVVVEGPKRP